MSKVVHISEESAALLGEQAEARGLSLEAWIERLASEHGIVGASVPVGATTRNSRTRAAAEGLIEMQKQIKPDPDGWTIRDYLENGRR